MKQRIRKTMRQVLAAIPPREMSLRSRQACELLIVMPEFRSANTVMLYLNMPAEVDTSGIALAAWQAGKTVLAPKVSWEQRHMVAMEIRSLETGLAMTTRGPKIREPEFGQPWPVEQIDFIVVPALAYDRRGNRLGRGMGFYDRFLAQSGGRAFTCGLAVAEQVIDEVPTTGQDQPVRALVTDKEVLRFQAMTNDEFRMSNQ